MPVWLVKATWTEDEAQASEQWEVTADTAHDAIGEATRHIRFRPHQVEAKLVSPEEATRTTAAPSDRARRIPPQ